MYIIDAEEDSKEFCEPVCDMGQTHSVRAVVQHSQLDGSTDHFEYSRN